MTHFYLIYLSTLNSFQCTILNETWQYMFPVKNTKKVTLFKTSKIDFKILKVAAAAYCLPQWSLNICFPPVEEGGWARIPCYDGGRHFLKILFILL